MRAVACVSLIAIALGESYYQPIDRPTFAVASIKTYPDGSPYPPGGGNTVHTSPDGITARFIRFDASIRWAYDIRGVITGPDWIRAERLDIAAKADGPVSEGRLRLMLRALLEERFNLKLHTEMRELPAVALIVGKNGIKNLPPTGTVDPPELKAAEGELVVKHAPLSLFATYLENKPPYGLQQLVVDQTGLNGTFDISISVKDFNTEDPAFAGDWEEMRSALFALLSERLEKQYGLKLEHRNVSLESIVVDSATRAPTPN